MKKRLDMLTSKSRVELDSEAEEEIREVIDTHTTDMMSLPGSDFRKIFWDQQVMTVFPCVAHKAKHFF